MDKKALKLASLFAYSPNSRGYCGLDSANSEFQKCIKYGKCEGVAKELKSFITLYPYLKTISKVRKLKFHDYKVVEAYWLGNELLKNFPISGYEILINEFIKQGVPKWLTDDLSRKVPKKFIPHHLFQVLHVGVGQASGSVPFNLNSINNCMIRIGEIESVSGNGLIMNIENLNRIKNGYVAKTKRVKMNTKSALFIKPHVNDYYCVHWGQIVKKLTSKEFTNLKHWTDEVLSSLR
ncbi:MAG: DUF6390 family protein [Patescibacteria group bacterium]